MKRKNILLLITLICLKLYSQDFPQDFINPLKIANSLSANFGELRKNHFHSGLDIRTQQRTGLEVIAPQDGYISRINISPYGYGKALYLQHENGYTTVFGHLESFSYEIEEKARKEQYQKQNYTVDFTLEPYEIRVKKGQLIAYSGNTGGSGGPHLHFEVRNTQTEKIYNPFLFGFKVSDHISPTIKGVWIYSLQNLLKGEEKKLFVEKGKTYSVSGPIGIGIKTQDKSDTSPYTQGVYFIKTYVNEELISVFKTDQFSFNQSRMINASVDYPELILKNSWIYRTFLLPGNTLEMYEETKNKGIIQIEEGRSYAIKIEVGDFAGNLSNFSFSIQGIAQTEPLINNQNFSNKVVFSQPYFFSRDNITLEFKPNSFYQDFYFTYKKTDSNQYHIHQSSVPLQYPYQLTIKPDWAILDKGKESHYVIKRTTNFGPVKTDYLPTTYRDGKYYANPIDFGIFSLILDTIPPVVRCPILNQKQKINKRLEFIIKDDISGIDTYNLYIDGNWILAEYEYKKNSLFVLDLQKEGIFPGEHELKLIVTDRAHNTTTYLAHFEN